MLDFIAVLVIARWLAARAQAKGHPGYLAAVGVIGWIVGEALGLKLGELAGLDGAVLVTGLLGAGIGAGAGFVLVARLPTRMRSLPVHEREAIEKAFE